MTKFSALIAFGLMTVLAGGAYAAPPQRGGGGHGGAPHIGGGGHIGGGHFGGAPRVGGGMHIGGGHMAGPRFGGGGRPHFGGGPRMGGGPRFSGGRPAMRSAGRPNFRAQRSFAGRGHSFAGRGSSNRNASRHPAVNRNAMSAGRNRNAALNPNSHANLRSRAVRNALNSRSVAGALHNRAALRNSNARAQIAASAATAGWHDRHGRDGWWRHRHGGYGWVGPLFWPFAYYDMYDYAMWGYGDDPGFWDYGYNDIYAGLFAPYGYDDLAGYLPESTGAGTNGSQSGSAQSGNVPASGAATSEQLTQMCGEDSRDIAGLPIDQIQKAIQPNDAQRAALDDLANASVKAAQDIRAACPNKVALTAPDRLASMEQRIEAMISAVQSVQPPLQKFYDLLSDEQKARLNALGQEQSGGQASNNSTAANNKSGSSTPACETAQPGVTAWPASAIESRVHPTEAQRASLASLQDASAKAADLLKSSCQNSEAITPPARLEAVGKRLDTMLQSVKMVRTALDDFYGKLSDEQKAQFEAIGPNRSASSDEPGTAPSHIRHRHHASINGIIRRFISLAR
jgi:hypothetical protein